MHNSSFSMQYSSVFTARAWLLSAPGSRADRSCPHCVLLWNQDFSIENQDFQSEIRISQSEIRILPLKTDRSSECAALSSASHASGGGADGPSCKVQNRPKATETTSNAVPKEARPGQNQFKIAPASEFIILNTKFIIFNAGFIVFDAKFISFNTQFIIFNTQFIIFYALCLRHRQVASSPASTIIIDRPLSAGAPCS